MRILDVASWPHYPPRAGGAIRVHSLLTHLARRHEVRQFSNPKVGDRFRPGGFADVRVAAGYRQIRFHDPYATAYTRRMARSYHQRLAFAGLALECSRPPVLERLIEWADIVLAEYPWQFPSCRRWARNKPVVLAGHNFERGFFASVALSVGRDPDREPWVRWVGRLEGRAARDADLLLAVSCEDKRAMIDAYGVPAEKVLVVPNGADTGRIRPVDAAAKERRKQELGLDARPAVLFINSYFAPTGRPAAAWVERLAERTSRFQFVIAGGYFKHPERRGNLVITGPLDDVLPWFEAADFGVCPVAFGGGTKIKLMESMAAGLPTAAFAEAVRGTVFRHEEHLLIAPQQEGAILENLARLADKPPLARRLGAAARAATVEHYDWRAIAENLGMALEALVAEPTRSAEATAAALA